MYKTEIKSSMEYLSNDPNCLFIGYGLKYGSKGGGHLKDVDSSKIIETPVAENLMLSMAIGLSLEGFLPVVIYERFDFIMNAMDALVNHLDKISLISKNEFNPKVIIRCIVGSKTVPFFTGVTHTQDFSDSIQQMIDIPVYKLLESDKIDSIYKKCYYSKKSSIIVEYKDLYENF
jgi:pyruvate/2-oxoglutarate/acetoin dehydrogenase E1 component